MSRVQPFMPGRNRPIEVIHRLQNPERVGSFKPKSESTLQAYGLPAK